MLVRFQYCYFLFLANMDAVAGRFEIDWSKENLELARLTIVKKYNAETHSQSAIEGVLELKTQQGFTDGDIGEVTIHIFNMA